MPLRLLAQPNITTFGLISEYRTLKNARGVIVGDFNGDGIQDIASYDDQSLTFHFQGDDPFSWKTTSVTLDHVFNKVASGRCNGDRLSDLVTLVDDPSEIRVYLATPTKQFRLRWKTLLPEPFDTLTVGDINSDKKNDILLYGKKHLGVTILLGNGDGSFKEPSIILPDISFSGVTVTDANGDGLNDLIGISWIKNEVLCYSAYGKMKYSDPVSVPLSAEPTFIAGSMINADPLSDLFIGFEDQGRIQTFSGNGFGTFEQLQAITLPYAPVKFVPGDVNNDGMVDLMALAKTSEVVSIFLNDGHGTMEDRVVFATGPNPQDLIWFTDAGSHVPQLCVLRNNPGSLRIFHHSSIRPPEGVVLEYCVGPRPRGVIAPDINHDGRNDIVVANSGSKCLGVFFNQEGGRFGGEWTLPLPIMPSTLSSFVRDDSTSVIVAGGEEGEIAVTEINTRNYGHSSYMLPKAYRSEVLSVSADPPENQIHIYALLQNSQSDTATLTEYGQISVSRFTEKTYSRPENLPVLAASYLPGTASGARRFAVVTYDLRRRRLGAWEFHEKDGRDAVRPLFSFPVGENQKVLLWAADINNDRIPDLLLDVGDTLFASLGKNDTTFRRPVRCLPKAVSVAATEDLQISDLNGDGREDIIVNNSLTKTVEVYWGRGDGTFNSVTRLISSQGVGGFTLGDIDDDGMPELLLSDAVNGVLKIIQLRR